MKPNRLAKPFRYAAIAVLTALGTFLVFKSSPWSKPVIQIHAAPDSGCDLRAGPCTSVLDDGRGVRFSIEPRSIPPLLPLQLRVETIGFSAQRVSVDLNGVGMQMGYNRISLSKMPQGHFSAKGSLSVCIRDVMEWEALVSIEIEDARITVPFRFITVKNDTLP